MNEIQRAYVIDDQQKRIAVQLDIKTFEKIETILEEYALIQLMKEHGGEETLSLDDAKAYYAKIE